MATVIGVTLAVPLEIRILESEIRAELEAGDSVSDRNAAHAPSEVNWCSRLGCVDTFRRYIYLHGTPPTTRLGMPGSKGCIRMANWDVLRLARMMKPGFTAIFQA